MWVDGWPAVRLFDVGGLNFTPLGRTPRLLINRVIKGPGPSNHNISVDITTQLQASFERSTNMPAPAESFLRSEGAWAEANYASLYPARFIENTNTYMTVDKHVAPFSQSAKVGDYLSLHCP